MYINVLLLNVKKKGHMLLKEEEINFYKVGSVKFFGKSQGIQKLKSDTNWIWNDNYKKGETMNLDYLIHFYKLCCSFVCNDNQKIE